jgi:hypothetical protein
LDVEAIVEDAVEDGLADEVVVLGFGAELAGAGAEVLAAATAGGILSVEDVKPDDAAVRQGADEAVVAVSASAVATAGGAGMGQRSAADRDDLVSGLRLGGCS